MNEQTLFEIALTTPAEMLAKCTENDYLPADQVFIARALAAMGED